jgi:DNA-binding LytR/AlgR family response regulator
MDTDKRALDGLRILIVEDDFFLAEDLGCRLQDAGACVVGPIGFFDEAIAFVKSHCDSFDCAILDVSLHGRKSYGIADELVARKIAFVFTTGYGTNAIDDAYRNYPRCEKPLNERVLTAALLTARRAEAPGMFGG